MQLRPYQQNSINQIYAWFRKNPTGNPCLVLSTGAGKSIIIAELCRDAIQNWPETRILMITSSMELIDQNHKKLLSHWPDAPVGVYSAGLKKREMAESITFAGIQSIHNKANDLGHVDLCLIDECDLISHKDEGTYRKLIKNLTEINPRVRFVGLTATPYRMGHGYITDKPAIFNALIEPISLKKLIADGYLAPLRSKFTEFKQDASGVKIRGGEYVESELQKALDTEDQNQAAVKEVIARAEDRKHWLFFCAGVKHAENVRDILIENGITAACVTGDLPLPERTQIINDFKSGKIQAVTNCQVLSVGFDYPDIDLIAGLRPTMSPRVYVQCAGRGTRLKSHVDSCLYLDFAGNVQRHGPITDVQPPRKGGKGGGSAPVKTCQECQEIVHAAVRICPACGNPFPAPEPKPLALRDDDIMGQAPLEMDIDRWYWEAYTSQSDKLMLKVSYYGKNLMDPNVSEYLCVLHGGWAQQKAQVLLAQMMKSAGVEWEDDDNGPADAPLTPNDLPMIAEAMNQAQPPDKVQYKRDGKWFRVMSRHWDRQLLPSEPGDRHFIHIRPSDVSLDSSNYHGPEQHSESTPEALPTKAYTSKFGEFTEEELAELPF